MALANCGRCGKLLPKGESGMCQGCRKSLNRRDAKDNAWRLDRQDDFEEKRKREEEYDPVSVWVDDETVMRKPKSRRKY